MNHDLTERLSDVREIFEKSKLFKDFPGGRCDVVSNILGACLANVYRKSVFKKSGFIDVDCEHGHSWICIEETNIDITLDQFEFFRSAVVVSKDDSIWRRFSYDYKENMINHINAFKELERLGLNQLVLEISNALV